MTQDIRLLYIDLFCGAGGTTTGVSKAMYNGSRCAYVVACVNHDQNAIASHAANHPATKHFTEDIRTFQLDPMLANLSSARKKYPSAKVVLWASLECTNFSKAKGGPPSRGFKQSFELSFEVERKQNRAIRSMVEYSAENLQDCERLLRTWQPRLIARKKLLRSAIRLSRAVLSWIKEQDPSIDRTMAIADVQEHIRCLRLMLGKKVFVAILFLTNTQQPYALYARRHRHKVIGVAINAKYTFPHTTQI